MSLRTAFLTVVAWSVTFAVLGGLLGAALGTFAPDYYRSLFAGGRAPDFQPTQVGAGLGLTQGFAVGAALALAALGLMIWRESRLAAATSTAGESPASDARPAPTRRVSRAVWGAAALAMTGLASVVAFVCGGIVGQEQLYRAWTEQKLRRLEQVLASREFPDVHPGFSSAAQVYVEGSVPSEDSKRKLRERLVDVFGAEEAAFMVAPLDVGSSTSSR